MNNQYNLYSEQLVATTSITSDSNELAERASLDLSTEYITNSNSNVHIVNYLSLPNSELLQQQQQQQCDNDSSKQVESGYMQSKSQTHMLHHNKGGAADIFSSYDLPVLTPLKYVEYNTSAEEQIIMTNDDICDDVNEDDCVQDFKDIPIKNVKRNLPHKKRIAKKLNSDQFSIIISSGDDSAMRSVNVSQDPQFECTECGLTIIGQLDFYIHLKEHYEGQQAIMKQATKRKRILDETVENNLNINHHEELSMHVDDDPNSVPENLLIETLEDSQDDIKTEEIEGDAFEFSETEDMTDMEDFRKEVEKVVETIADAECMPDASWNYQPDEIEENHSNVGIIESFPEKLETICTEHENKDCTTIMDTSYVNDRFDSNSCVYTENDASASMEHIEENDDNDDDDDDDDEDEDDNKPLEEVRVMLKKTKKENTEREKTQNDRDEHELNECLKRIHNFKCNFNDCNKAFNSRTALGYHLKTHNAERRYVCESCGKKFLTNGALKVHLRLHTDERPYQCSHCNRSFRQFGDLRYHETSIHSNKKDHVCEFCAKAFARKYSLIIHRRIHTNERNYKCTECDKSFRASSYLLNHKRIHSGEKPYSCTYAGCHKKFRVHGDAKRHMKIHDRVKGIKEKKSTNQNLITHGLKEDDMKQKIIVKENEDLTSKSVADVNNQITKKGKKPQKRKSVK